jgi:hypothetical protein
MIRRFHKSHETEALAAARGILTARESPKSSPFDEKEKVRPIAQLFADSGDLWCTSVRKKPVYGLKRTPSSEILERRDSVAET